jgi:hypothetical protein
MTPTTTPPARPRGDPPPVNFFISSKRSGGPDEPRLLPFTDWIIPDLLLIVQPVYASGSTVYGNRKNIAGRLGRACGAGTLPLA